MATFFLIRDGNAERRAATAKAGIQRIAEFEGLETGGRDAGPLSLIWGARPHVPLDLASEGDRHAFVLGDAIADSAGRRASAIEHLHATREAEAAPVYDGFHAALSYDDAGGFQLGVDIIGLLPVYYVTLDDVVLVATSARLLALHPLFRGSLDPFGLAALLATNGIIEGRTLYRGVTRLEQGHALTAPAGSAPSEHEHYSIPVSTDLHEAPHDVCGSELYESFRAACRRHIPAGVPHTLMLSGGLDSRLIGGVLAAEERTITAMTRGKPGDIEYRCAQSVAKHLGFEHHLVPHDERGPEGFPETVHWDGLTGSPGSGSSGGGALALRRFHPVAVTGYLGDAILGGTHLSWIEKQGTPPIGFDWAWWRLANWSLPVEVLERLLRKDVFGDALQNVRETYRGIYEAAGDTHHMRNYRLGLRYRNRFGIGDVVAGLTFGAWPRTPHIDRDVIRVSASIPPAVLAGRSLEKYILERFHLGLACLPLDRNSYDRRPIVPRVSHWIEHAVSRRVREIQAGLGLSRENRYYFRTYDINGPDWKTIRRMVEPFRERAYSVFEREVFDELIPPPDTNIAVRTGIADVSGKKNLLAFLLMQPLLTET